MLNEIVTQSHILLPGVEQSFGTLTSPHELTEIIVNANGELQANSSQWRLYEVTPAGSALIWHGALTPPFEGAQRLTPANAIPAGARIELRGISLGNQPTTGPVTASLIGFDPNCCGDETGTGGTTTGGDAVVSWGAPELDSENPAAERCLVQGWGDVSVEVIDYPASRPGTFRNLYVKQSGTEGALGSVTYSLVINHTPTALAVTLDTDFSGVGSDLIDSISIEQGDFIAFVATPTNDVNIAPTLITASADFQR